MRHARGSAAAARQPRRPRPASAARRRARSCRAPRCTAARRDRHRASRSRCACQGGVGTPDPARVASSHRGKAARSPNAASVPAAPPNCRTSAASPGRRQARPRSRSNAAHQPAAFRPNVIGAAGCSSVRPSITVAACVVGERAQARDRRARGPPRAAARPLEAAVPSRCRRRPGWWRPSARLRAAPASIARTRSRQRAHERNRPAWPTACVAGDGGGVERARPRPPRSMAAAAACRDHAGARLGARQRRFEIEHRLQQRLRRRRLRRARRSWRGCSISRACSCSRPSLTNRRTPSRDLPADGWRRPMRPASPGGAQSVAGDRLGHERQRGIVGDRRIAGEIDARVQVPQQPAREQADVDVRRLHAARAVRHGAGPNGVEDAHAISVGRQPTEAAERVAGSSSARGRRAYAPAASACHNSISASGSGAPVAVEHPNPHRMRSPGVVRARHAAERAFAS